MESETQCLEIDQAKGMAWKITFHLPSEAIKHERKFPKEVRYLSLPISADSLDAQCSGMIHVGGPREGRERKRPPRALPPPMGRHPSAEFCCSSQTLSGQRLYWSIIFHVVEVTSSALPESSWCFENNVPASPHFPGMNDMKEEVPAR